MKVIVGLGNPDSEYKNTYHNVGFMAIDKFASINGFEFSSKKYDALVAVKNINNEKVFILKPQTYMNLSGKSVSAIINKLKIPLENLLVVYDDLDLPIGTARFRLDGSAGTHNGVRNIVALLGNDKFARLRIGTASSEMKGDLIKFVLSKISNQNMEILDKVIEKSCEEIYNFIVGKKLEPKTIKVEKNV